MRNDRCITTMDVQRRYDTIDVTKKEERILLVVVVAALVPYFFWVGVRQLSGVLDSVMVMVRCQNGAETHLL